MSKVAVVEGRGRGRTRSSGVVRVQNPREEVEGTRFFSFVLLGIPVAKRRAEVRMKVF